VTDRPSAPSGDERAPAAGIDTNVPHTARVWNYWLGGKDNFAVDRMVGDQTVAVFPQIRDNALSQRAFLARAVRYLAGEAGIRQFLDIGTGLPSANNTHQVAQSVAPECRIVYVDNDPLVLVHARALLTSNSLGATDYVDADLRDPEPILAAAVRTLDFAEPVALMLLGILAHLPYDDARAVVRRLLADLPSGSYLVVADGANTNEALVEGIRRYNEHADPPYELRSPARIAGYFEGLEQVPPGVVPLPHWRPELGETGPVTAVDGIGGVGRKP
jgi:O-methyltransferase involved in polyketide biosynthesis